MQYELERIQSKDNYMTMKIRSFLIITIVFFGSLCTIANAEENEDYTSVPAFTSTEVKPNILFILDNSNSMDEDVDGAAVGGTSPLSRSEIARNAILQIIRDQQDNMRFGLMAYNQQNVTKRFIHNSFYYSSFGADTYDADATPTPRDPTENTKRFINPTDTANFIYYDTALPYYNDNNDGVGFCYSQNFTYADDGANHSYRCYRTKTGDDQTPMGLNGPQLGDWGYSDYFNSYTFAPTDSDFAAGFYKFGYEMSWVPIGDTWFSNSSPGGGLLHVNIEDSSASQIAEMEAKLATSQFDTATDTPLRNAGLTPIAGTIDSARNYFMGATVSSVAGVTSSNPITLECQKNYVILVTDGLPSVDSNGNTGDADDLLAEVEGSITDLRSTQNVDFDNPFDVQTYVIGFAIPEELGSKLNDLAVAGGTDVDGEALLANSAVELGQVLNLLFRDISKKVASGASASVVSNSVTGEGVTYQSVFYPEYTDDLDDPNTVTWVGNVSSLFIDSYGNLREDSNGDKKYDIDEDYLIVYRDNGSGVVAWRYSDSNQNNFLDIDEDLNGNGVLDYDLNEDTNNNGVLDAGEDLNGNNLLDASVDEDRNGNELLDQDEDTNNNGELDDGEDTNGDGELYVEDEFIDEIDIADLGYVWEANDWLNEITDADIVTQRSYGTVDERRYIFTFVDANGDKIVDSDEQVNFTEYQFETLAEHLIVYPALTDEPSWLATIRSDGNYDDFIENQSKRIINYIRGMEQGEFTSTTTTQYTLDAMRSRVADYDDDGTAETWRLGDVIHSSPMAVGAPVEAFHLLYDDYSYAEFVDKYSNRRTMVYVGGNDGMIHAFNGGFYDSATFQVNKYSVTNSEPYLDENSNGEYDNGEPFTDRNYNGFYDDGIGNETQHEIGSEMWAYIPYNLLPQLRFLTEADYQHVYYNDLSPRVFDAKIFTPESQCSASIYNSGCIHPNGWGTVLVAGMRFGGGLYNKSKTWDFVDDSENWTFTPADDVTQTFTDGNWVVTADENLSDPQFISPANVEIDGEMVKTVEIRFTATSADAGAGGVTLYWDGSGDVDNEQWDDGNVTISTPSVHVSGDFYTYTFDLTGVSAWSGTIKRLRFDIESTFLELASTSIDYVDVGDGDGYTSSYSVIDITNPEEPPVVLAELNADGLGYTTAMPTVIPIKSLNDNSINDWYLVFGSGPNYNQQANSSALENATSNTTGKIFVTSLKDIVQYDELKMLDSDGELLDGEQIFAEIDSNTFVSDFITIDLDLDYDADVVYFGTISGNDAKGWGGKMRRLLFNGGSTDTTTWVGDSALFTAPIGQSITAAASVGVDNNDNYWVYFGSGRYFIRDDVEITTTQNYYGIKEPEDSDGDLTWDPVGSSSLLDTTDAVVYDDRRITGLSGISSWYELIQEIDTSRRGWMFDLETTGERNLGQAALLGGIVTFTTYIPSADLCSRDGVSDGYGVYYKTGTAYYQSVFGYTYHDDDNDKEVDTGERELDKKFTVGKGVTYSPAVHTGGDDGSSVIFQTSDGSIKSMEEDNPGLTKSQKTGWQNITQ